MIWLFEEEGVSEAIFNPSTELVGEMLSIVKMPMMFLLEGE